MNTKTDLESGATVQVTPTTKRKRTADEDEEGEPLEGGIYEGEFINITRAGSTQRDLDHSRLHVATYSSYGGNRNKGNQRRTDIRPERKITESTIPITNDENLQPSKNARG